MGTALQNRQMFNANNGGPGGSGVNAQRQNILGLMTRQGTAAENAFSAAHQGFPSTPYAPGYQQNWENNWNAQQQPQNQLGVPNPEQFNQQPGSTAGAPFGGVRPIQMVPNEYRFRGL
jgi:hypothetical protein